MPGPRPHQAAGQRTRPDDRDLAVALRDFALEEDDVRHRLERDGELRMIGQREAQVARRQALERRASDNLFDVGFVRRASQGGFVLRGGRPALPASAAMHAVAILGLLSRGPV